MPTPRLVQLPQLSAAYAACKDALATYASHEQELENTVIAYAESCRLRGEPLEHVLLQIRDVTRAATASSAFSHVEQDELSSRIMSWCIERYQLPPS